MIQKQRYLDWRFIFVSGFVVLFAVLFFLTFLKDKFQGLVDNQLFNDFYPIFVTLILMNIMVATYTLSVYQYKITAKGMKGPRGRIGAKGPSGDNVTCDLITPKIKRFRFKKDPNPEKYSVDLSVLENATLDLENARVIPQWTTSNKLGVTNVSKDILGIKKSNCLNDGTCKLSKNIGVEEMKYDESDKSFKLKKNLKPFNGAIVNYKEGENSKVNTLQFTFDENDTVLKTSKVIKPLTNYDSSNEPLNQKIGIQYNTGKNGDFSCPPHSAIYKIETLHKNPEENNKTGEIKGIKFHCRDIVTGEKTRSLDSDNNLVYEPYFGVEPKISNKDHIYNSVQCGNIKRKLYNTEEEVIIPGFLSNYDVVDSEDGIQALKFNHCSFYHKNPNDFKRE